MSDDVQEALAAARAAVAAANEALARAERAAGRSGAADPTAEPETVDVLRVRRVEVVEDDGTLRLILGNSTLSGTAPMRGELREHPGRAPSAGLLFVNDEGTECGGLTFRGHGARPDEPGPTQAGYLTFDAYEQNEALRIGLGQSRGGTDQFIEFVDRPEWSLVDLVDDLETADPADHPRLVAERRAQGEPHSRVLLARDERDDARLVLRDGLGRDRLRLVVHAHGDPDIEVVDVDGRARSLLTGDVREPWPVPYVDEVSDLLDHEWDPIGVYRGHPSPGPGEYRDYAGDLLLLLRDGADGDALAEQLALVRAGAMGLEPGPEDAHAAQALVRWWRAKRG